MIFSCLAVVVIVSSSDDKTVASKPEVLIMYFIFVKDHFLCIQLSGFISKLLCPSGIILVIFIPFGLHAGTPEKYCECYYLGSNFRIAIYLFLVVQHRVQGR